MSLICADCSPPLLPSVRRRNRETVYASLARRSVADPAGANVTQIMLNGAEYRIQDQKVYMPPFGPAYSDAELAAVANYVIAHFGGKTGRITPEDVAKQRQESAIGRRASSHLSAWHNHG